MPKESGNSFKENWLSVRFCEIAAIRQEQGKEILEWLEKKKQVIQKCVKP